jgi:hypothetical protein
MTDFTTTHLEAAIIDQVVAGEFAGKTYAFVAIIHEGYKLGVAVANESGYSPIGGKMFDSFDEAKTWAKGLNEHIGLSAEQVAHIIISTMGGKTFRVA